MENPINMGWFRGKTHCFRKHPFIPFIIYKLITEIERQIYPLSSNDFERQIPTGDTFALIDFDILQTLQSDQLKSKSTIESKNSRFLSWIES